MQTPSGSDQLKGIHEAYQYWLTSVLHALHNIGQGIYFVLDTQSITAYLGQIQQQRAALLDTSALTAHDPDKLFHLYVARTYLTIYGIPPEDHQTAMAAYQDLETLFSAISDPSSDILERIDLGTYFQVLKELLEELTLQYNQLYSPGN